MLSHTTVGVADVHRARLFYDPLLEALGLVLKHADDEWAGWKQPDADRPLFVATRPFDGAPATAGNGQMNAFLARTRAIVDRCHAIALAQGGRCEGKPGLRPEYDPDYYGAYFRDPDGNKLCVVCRTPE